MAKRAGFDLSNQRGGLPRPLHVVPLAGSRYFGATARVVLGARRFAPSSSGVMLYAVIRSRIFESASARSVRSAISSSFCRSAICCRRVWTVDKMYSLFRSYSGDARTCAVAIFSGRASAAVITASAHQARQIVINAPALSPSTVPAVSSLFAAVLESGPCCRGFAFLESADRPSRDPTIARLPFSRPRQ